MLRARAALDRITRGDIEGCPHLSARGLATRLVGETDWLTLQVRQLKTLGLTVSHHPGHTRSPRGHAVLGHLRRAAPVDPRSDPPAGAPDRHPC